MTFYGVGPICQANARNERGRLFAMPSITDNKPTNSPEVTPGVPLTQSRKDDHIRINLEQDVQFRRITTGLDALYFAHSALPELDLQQVNLGLTLFGRQLSSPLLISSMTGGTEWAGRINRTLAEAAQHTRTAMGLGSMRAALEDDAVARTFQVRDIAPDILLFANLGAVQLNYGYGPDDCRRAVELVQADALILHLNPLQEAVQPEGDTNFAGLIAKIDQVAQALAKDNIPVVVKEVGWGFSAATARQLAQTAIAAIDVAGAGGTSWSEVEMHRTTNPSHRRIAAAFIDWGISTADALHNVRTGAPNLRAFASGGLRNGIDMAKCVALGATLTGMAGPFLKAAVNGAEALETEINDTHRELRIAAFAAGAGDLATLAQTPLLTR